MKNFQRVLLIAMVFTQKLHKRPNVKSANTAHIVAFFISFTLIYLYMYFKKVYLHNAAF